MSEDLFISSAFAESMQPSRIVPFYYRASNTFDKEDITITTLVTSNRFKVFSELVQRYQGPISVTIHVPDHPAQRHALLDALHTLYTSTPYMSSFVDVHLVLDPFERQFNMWRNVARFFAPTDYVMMLDVDFAVCTDFRRRIRESAEVMEKLREGRTALVVPAFEFTEQRDGLNQSTFPKDKAALLELVKEKRIGMFHALWHPGHGNTDYERFYAAKPGEVYKVATYQHSYEPYVIFKKDGPPWCDERFIGYGSNKASCLFEIYLSGVSFYVLPDDFLIHQSHAYAEQIRKHERKYNTKLYTEYREEACLRFVHTDCPNLLHAAITNTPLCLFICSSHLVRFHQAGMIHTEQAHNARIECQKLRAVAKFAVEV
ncbi:glycosyltransferase family 49 protein [Botryobasidium botryosum FD-172 SS1]|uniref:Glycosyltransferase family 49 protein n=1 Tax=Botryobasidium botryosum (strain FD-172 SS1) TaxID=930990 RepID=A0A067MA89_BOTB1|nr:glycosyltransferase family 49 protein [Botryobasidium botryosum FD-172 SS1]